MQIAKASTYLPGLVAVFDDVLVDPHAYRAHALAQSFGDVQAGPDTFKGIAQASDATLETILTALVPAAEPTLSFFRRSPFGQREPNYVHSDADMGDWTAILYLHPEPPAGDGTTFWRHVANGEVYGPQDGLSRDTSDWRKWLHIDAWFGRMLLFRSDLFHSRGLIDNYGRGDDARLIQVMFGRGDAFAREVR